MESLQHHINSVCGGGFFTLLTVFSEHLPADVHLTRCSFSSGNYDVYCTLQTSWTTDRWTRVDDRSFKKALQLAGRLGKCTIQSHPFSTLFVPIRVGRESGPTVRVHIVCLRLCTLEACRLQTNIWAAVYTLRNTWSEKCTRYRIRASNIDMTKK